MQKKIKVLIADDDPNIRMTLKDILAEKGFIAETANNGYELLASLKKKLPNIIILDLMMPEKDGIEVISTIKSISTDIKIIIYTGFRKYEKSTYAHLADIFLLKATGPEKLLQAIIDLSK